MTPLQVKFMPGMSRVEGPAVEDMLYTNLVGKPLVYLTDSPPIKAEHSLLLWNHNIASNLML
jgi:hypothetical protein